ncbi:MAG: PorV/PorQ family protein, partial [Bacteroidota bacterium]
DQFSFGTTVRYVEETQAAFRMRSVMVDLGTFYRTGIGSSRFAVVISNFGGDVSPSGEANLPDGRTVTPSQTYSLPTLFKLGIAFEPLETEEERITASLQLNHPNDNSEHLRLGMEFAWRNTLFLRCGVKRTIGQPVFGEDGTTEEDFSLGAGFQVPLEGSMANADYAFTSFNRLGSVHRFSLAFSF